MKWIGQHIFDYISRFRNDVYVDKKIIDSTGSAGSSGDILTTTGTTVAWSSATVASTTYIWEQAGASTTWVINHYLKKYPSVTIITSTAAVVICDVFYNSADQLTVTLLQSESGKAYLN
jgi:hypothetical protein